MLTFRTIVLPFLVFELAGTTRAAPRGGIIRPIPPPPDFRPPRSGPIIPPPDFPPYRRPPPRRRRTCRRRKGGCFPSFSTVTEVTKGAMPIKNVQVGDKLLAFTEKGRLQYSEVIGWMHFDEDMVVEYYEIHAADGRKITLSENHLIVKVNGAAAEKSYAFASNIKVGDLLLTKDDATPDSVVTPSEVVNITKSWIAGAYAPLTREGTIIVDDVAASCYASVDDHDLIHAALFPVRVVHRIIPGMFQGDPSYLGTYLDFLKYGARLVIDKKQFHPISSINNKVITIF